MIQTFTISLLVILDSDFTTEIFPTHDTVIFLLFLCYPSFSVHFYILKNKITLQSTVTKLHGLSVPHFSPHTIHAELLDCRENT